MNYVNIIGRLTADPELKTTGSGISVTNICIAVDRKGTKGENKVTDWIDVVAWRNTAEFICKYFSKGDPIVISGSIQTRMWEDGDGKKRKTVEVIADNAEFVPKAKGEAPAIKVGDADSFQIVEEDEDIPF